MAWVSAELVRRFAGLRVVVVGDLMLDRYITGRVHRISPEAPVPVVEVDRTFERPGGAANVAANARSLGAHTIVLGVIGADSDGNRLREVLDEASLSADRLVTTTHHPTTVKTRVVAHGQQIVRIDRETSQFVDDSTADAVLDAFARIDRPDVVILSDYAKGVLSHRVCSEVISRCRERGTPVVVDPKGKDYRRYARATAVTPNQHEAAQALGVDDDRTMHFDRVRQLFLEELAMDAALVTQGELGMTLLLPNGPPIRLPATAHDVADVTGAGDTAATVFAMTVATGASFEESAILANAAAGVVVGKAGTATISPDELLDALQPRGAARGHRSR
jgi:rfaE bifunctional protein kinase chain/domain